MSGSRRTWRRTSTYIYVAASYKLSCTLHVLDCVCVVHFVLDIIIRTRVHSTLILFLLCGSADPPTKVRNYIVLKIISLITDGPLVCWFLGLVSPRVDTITRFTKWLYLRRGLRTPGLLLVWLSFLQMIMILCLAELSQGGWACCAGQEFFSSGYVVWVSAYMISIYLYSYPLLFWLIVLLLCARTFQTFCSGTHYRFICSVVSFLQPTVCCLKFSFRHVFVGREDLSRRGTLTSRYCFLKLSFGPQCRDTKL